MIGPHAPASPVRTSTVRTSTVVAALPDGSLLERQVVHYILQVARTLTTEDWREVAVRAKPAEEAALVSLAAQEWINQGRVQGQAQGRAEGEARALERSVLRTLTARFGPVPDDVAARVRDLPVADLDRLFERALAAPDLASVFQDHQPSSP